MAHDSAGKLRPSDAGPLPVSHIWDPVNDRYAVLIGASTSVEDGRLIVIGAAAQGVASVGAPLLVAGLNGANVKVAQVDSAGNALVSLGTTLDPGNDKIAAFSVYPSPIVDAAGTVYTVKRAVINASANGDNTVVAAVAGKKLVVLEYGYVTGGTVQVKWRSATAGTDLSGAKPFAANGGEVRPYSPVGWVETVAGQALVLNLNAAVQVGGELSYIEA